MDMIRKNHALPRPSATNAVALGKSLQAVVTVLALGLLVPAIQAEPCPDYDLDNYADCSVPGCDSIGLSAAA